MSRTIEHAESQDGIRQSEIAWLATTGRFEFPAVLIVQDHEYGERLTEVLRSFGRHAIFVEGEITTPWEGVSPEPDALARRYSLKTNFGSVHRLS